MTSHKRHGVSKSSNSTGQRFAQTSDKNKSNPALLTLHEGIHRWPMDAESMFVKLDRRQAIIRTNAGVSLKGPLGTKFGEILIAIHICQNMFQNVVCKMVAILSRPHWFNKKFTKSTLTLLF